MFLVGLLQWWYGRGWLGQLGAARDRIRSTADYFSIGQLIETLFAPFRQISAGKVNGTVGQQMRALLDKIISRVIGGIVRFFTIIIGVVAILAQVVVEGVILIVWLVLPAFPVVGFIMFAIGWVPQWI